MARARFFVLTWRSPCISTMSGSPVSSCITSVLTTACSSHPELARRLGRAAVVDVVIRMLGEGDAARAQPRRGRRLGDMLVLACHAGIVPRVGRSAVRLQTSRTCGKVLFQKKWRGAPMTGIESRLRALSPERLNGMRRGIEKESLRAQPDGALALTPHPAALGSALTHPHITTDYSESAARADHRRARRRRGLPGRAARASTSSSTARWPQSATRCCGSAACPAACPPTRRSRSAATARRTSAAPRASTAWAWATATGGACRPSRASTTTGRCRGLGNDEYFALIRNFRRHAFLLLYAVRRLAGGVLELRRRARRTSCRR